MAGLSVTLTVPTGSGQSGMAISSIAPTPSVTVVGTLLWGATATGVTANITGITSRQWWRVGTGVISGATGPTYVFGSADAGKFVYQTVTHSGGVTTSPTVGPVGITDTNFFAKSSYVYFMNASKGPEVIAAGGSYLDTMYFDDSAIPTGDVLLSSTWPNTAVPGGGVFCYNFLDIGDYYGGGFVPTPVPSRQVSGLAAGQVITTTDWLQTSGNGNFNILEETWLTVVPNVRGAAPREVGFFYNAPQETIDFHNSQTPVGTYPDQAGQSWSVGVGGTYWTFLKLGATTPAQAILNHSVRDWGHMLTWLRGVDASFAAYYLNGAAMGEEVLNGGGARTHTLNYQKTAWS